MWQIGLLNCICQVSFSALTSPSTRPLSRSLWSRCRHAIPTSMLSLAAKPSLHWQGLFKSKIQTIFCPIGNSFIQRLDVALEASVLVEAARLDLLTMCPGITPRISSTHMCKYNQCDSGMEIMFYLVASTHSTLSSRLHWAPSRGCYTGL